MKPTVLLLAAAAALPLHAQSSSRDDTVTPPPVREAPPAPQRATEPRFYDQRDWSPRGAFLVPPDQARAIIERFRGTYERLGKPRLLLYINRELVDERSGLNLTGRTERTEASRTVRDGDFVPAPGATGGISVQAGGDVTIEGGAAAGTGTLRTESQRVTGENTYTQRDRPQRPLADRQTEREIERMFGRPLRLAGAALADQTIGAQLLADRGVTDLLQPQTGEAAARDREALRRHADVVIEILIAPRVVPASSFDPEAVATIPDIQVTAVRLSDAAVLGQASSTDVLGNDRDAARLARQFTARDIAEATALALLEDLALAAPPPPPEAP